MNIFETIVLGCTIISFPYIVEVLFLAYHKDYTKEQRDLFVDIAMMSSLLLIINFFENNLLLLNIPLLISFVTGRKIISIVMSLIIITSNYVYLDYNIVLGSLEYIFYYFLVYSLLKKQKEDKKIIIFLISKILITLLIHMYIYYLGSGIYNYCIVLISTALFIYYLRDSANNIIRLHMQIKEIENEAQIKNSLFKITHEIKNPIAVCKGYLDMFDVDSTDHSTRYVPILKEEIEKTLMLLQDFLQMTNIKINSDIIDVNMLLEEVADNYKMLLKSYNIKFENNIIDDEVYIDGDYNRLMQVFLNIVKNSIEAIGSNGVIKIDTKLDKKYIYVNIKDNGSGISEEDLEKIKQPFYTTKKNGTGLGVSLAHEIIKSHGGIIKYTSSKNEGTNVFIKLKLYKI